MFVLAVVADAGGKAVPSQEEAPPSIWTFIAADCAGFAIFFLVFMAERLKDPTLFDASARKLDVRLGLANTVILISSGLLVALAATAAERGDDRRARHLLIGGLAVGACFAVIKIAEYAEKIGDGITPTTNGFFTFYFILTGVHFLHYVIGVAVLAAMISALRRRERSGDGAGWIESGGLYWHMVDLLWLFLFPMLYLLPAR